MKLKIPIIEIILSLISSWWALVLLQKPKLFQALPDLYTKFADVSDQKYWAIVFIVAASIKILGIVINNKSLRKLGLFLSAILYGLIAAGLIMGSTVLNTGTGTYAALSLMAFWGIREVEIRDGA